MGSNVVLLPCLGRIKFLNLVRHGSSATFGRGLTQPIGTLETTWLESCILQDNLDVSINQADLAQSDKVSGQKSVRFIKICASENDFFISGRFSPHPTTTEDKIGRQIITCKLAHGIEPICRV